MASAHWADVAADAVIARDPKDSYTVASGITPSGIVHFGNFREVITTSLVAQALRERGKKVRFIYSWDDYDVFRKVPANMPRQEILQQSLRHPVVDVPDVYGCHGSYAEHHEKTFEAVLSPLGIYPEFLYQAQRYRACRYAEGIKLALQHKVEIIAILNQWRAEALDDSWWPVTGFCAQCGKDDLTFSSYDGSYGLSYHCGCGFSKTVDLRRDGELSLLWRVDWPMRWAYEKVDFEPGGKDHSTVGGSYTTAQPIVRDVYSWRAPFYVMYDFIRIKGGPGKISSSTGEIVTVQDVLSVYEPMLVRWLFAGTRPNTEFAVSFDADVIKNYEDFDRLERVYFGEESCSEQQKEKLRRIYELSCVETLPASLPYQPSFRHLTNVLQMHDLDIAATISFYVEQLISDFDRVRLATRAQCAKSWLLTYAPDEFRYTINKEPPQILLSDLQKALLLDFIAVLQSRTFDDKSLHEEFYVLCARYNVPHQEFFELIYGLLISKKKGPRLASFVLLLGVPRVIALLHKVVHQ